LRYERIPFLLYVVVRALHHPLQLTGQFDGGR
jgi:hypothetical protein